MKDKIKQSLNCRISILYRRKKASSVNDIDINHTLTGKVVRIRKKSVLFEINDELTIPIGYRNVISFDYL